MANFDCNDFEITVRNLMSGDEKRVSTTLTCWYDHFYQHLKARGEAICCSEGKTVGAHSEELASLAISKVVESLYLAIRLGLLKDKGIPMLALLASYFFQRLMWEIADLQERKVKEAALRPSPDDPEPVDEEQVLLLQKGFDNLKERCRNLVVWRKLLGLDSKAIAALTGISEDMVDNEVWRCMRRLQNIVDHLGGK